MKFIFLRILDTTTFHFTTALLETSTANIASVQSLKLLTGNYFLASLNTMHFVVGKDRKDGKITGTRLTNKRRPLSDHLYRHRTILYTLGRLFGAILAP